MSALRPITVADRAGVLAWNQANVELLAPLDADRLAELIDWSDRAAVILQDDTDAGFVLTFAEGSGYDSVNYRWFASRHPRFVYLDRVVVDPSVRRSGLGTRVYDELEGDAARTGTPVFCLEVNIEPPNAPSLAFHQHRGYVEVGRQDANGHVVALLEKALLL